MLSHLGTLLYLVNLIYFKLAVVNETCTSMLTNHNIIVCAFLTLETSRYQENKQKHSLI
jgi:hypothetical protein